MQGMSGNMEKTLSQSEGNLTLTLRIFSELSIDAFGEKPGDSFLEPIAILLQGLPSQHMVHRTRRLHDASLVLELRSYVKWPKAPCSPITPKGMAIPQQFLGRNHHPYNIACLQLTRTQPGIIGFESFSRAKTKGSVCPLVK